MQGHTTLKSKLTGDIPLCGTFIFSSDPATSEIAARAGFDFVIVDREHTSLSWRDVAAHVRASDAVGVPSLVRVRRADADEIGHALDVGAQGVVIPHFGLNREAAAGSVAAARYAPLGNRGTCTGIRAAGYGLDDFGEAVAHANRDTLLMVQIEDVAAASALDAILSQVSVDAILPGLADLSTALGHPAAFAHPRVTALVDRILADAAKHNVPVGFYVANAQALSRWSGGDVRFCVYGIDYKVLAESYREARTALDRQWKSGMGAGVPGGKPRGVGA